MSASIAWALSTFIFLAPFFFLGFLAALAFVIWFFSGRVETNDIETLGKIITPLGGFLSVLIGIGLLKLLTPYSSPIGITLAGAATGCILFALLAAFMANGWRIADAVRALKGRRGEAAVAKVLRNAGIEAVHGLYLRTRSGVRATQVDHVARCGHGLLVIETKNLEGVFGAGDIGRADKAALNQNARHIAAVREQFRLPVTGLVVIGKLARFPDGLPEGICPIHDLPARLAFYRSRPGAGIPNDAWAKVVAFSANVGEQSQLSSIHRAFRHVRKRRDPEFQPAVCEHCHGTDVTPSHGTQPSYSPFLRCSKCRGVTTYRAPVGWEVVIERGGLRCEEDETGEVHVVIPERKPPAKAEPEATTVERAIDTPEANVTDTGATPRTASAKPVVVPGRRLTSYADKAAGRGT